MQAAFTLVKIAKEDAAEAVRLYFEPLFRLMSWVRHLLISEAENNDRSHLLTSVEAMEARERSVEVLELAAQVNDRLRTTMTLLEASLIPLQRTEPELLISRLSLLAADSSLLESEARVRAMSRYRELLNTDMARLDTVLLAIDFGQSSLLSAPALRSLIDDLQPIIGAASVGGTVHRGHLLTGEEPYDERQLRLFFESIEEPKVPEIGRQALGRFGVYLEVAAFLALEGYEEAAVAIVDRAFKLFRPGERINK